MAINYLAKGEQTRFNILQFLYNERKLNRFPSIREIGVAVGIRSSSTIHNHVTTLARQGKVRLVHKHGSSRNIELVLQSHEVCPFCFGSGMASDYTKEIQQKLENGESG